MIENQEQYRQICGFLIRLQDFLNEFERVTKADQSLAKELLVDRMQGYIVTFKQQIVDYLKRPGRSEPIYDGDDPVVVEMNKFLLSPDICPEARFLIEAAIVHQTTGVSLPITCEF